MECWLCQLGRDWTKRSSREFQIPFPRATRRAYWYCDVNLHLQPV